MKVIRVAYTGNWCCEGRKKGTSQHRSAGQRRFRRSIKKKLNRMLDRLDRRHR